MNADIVEQIQTFYIENRRALYTYALVLVRDREAAEDIVHHVFEKLLKKGAAPTSPKPGSSTPPLSRRLSLKGAGTHHH